MCGITGFFTQDEQTDKAQLTAIIADMTHAMVVRGPDDFGVWVDDTCQAVLGHRRLAINDLSPAGHQPMLSSTGRFVMVFNGEIYNHLRIRQNLESQGHAPLWRGHSDTETLLAAIELWGLPKTLKHCVGMFAIALWDRAEKKLYLARDRMGEKPLYYGFQGQARQAVFLFGSELKALQKHPAFKGEICREALTLFLKYNYIPAPYTIYQGIYKLNPGCYLTFSHQEQSPEIFTYWSLPSVIETCAPLDTKLSEKDILDELEGLLMQSVGQQMLADVPLGAFLSGGIDSSTIVALMQKQSSRPIQTFSIGFNEKGFDEAQYAKAVAQHLGTAHTELYVSSKEAMDVIPSLATIYDEPFADSSQIPTHLVSKLARKQVTVCLSGDAGDELFGGYNRYFWTKNIWRSLSITPMFIKKMISGGITTFSPQAWDNFFTLLFPTKTLRLGDKLHKASGVLCAPSIDACYAGLISSWPQPQSVVNQGHIPETMLTHVPQALRELNPISRMMALDTLTYLPDDILVKVDRAAMAVSLETRVPFLDHRVVEYAWRMPQNLKFRNRQGKWALRQILYRHVPKHLIDRPKMGFGVPIDQWLRGELKDWAYDLLNPEQLKQQGFLDATAILKKWEAHQRGQQNYASQLWAILMFQSWLLEHKK